jgi:hypothetical protein
MKIIFMPRTKAFWINTPDVGIKDPTELMDKWGTNYALVTLDDQGKFPLNSGDNSKGGNQVYVLAGHGKPGVGTVYWDKEGENLLEAKEVAELTAKRFPTDCTGVVKLKIWSCHSGEGGHNSFASQFDLAFKPVGLACEIEIYGYHGKISQTIPYRDRANCLEVLLPRSRGESWHCIL